MLDTPGDHQYILLLQGFLFFGTATGLLDQIRGRMADPAKLPVQFIILDCRRVSGVDASAALAFDKLRRLARNHAIDLVLTGLAPPLRQALRRAALVDAQDAATRVFPDLDRGVEWCEDRILADAHAADAAWRPLAVRLADLLPSPGMTARLIRYLERVEVPAGTCVIRQGAAADDLYLVESGRMAVMLKAPNGRHIRLRVIDAGAVVGELGFYLGTPRTASIIAERPSIVYRLNSRALGDLRAAEPDVAAAFSEMMMRLLAERVIGTNETVAALLQ